MKCIPRRKFFGNNAGITALIITWVSVLMLWAFNDSVIAKVVCTQDDAMKAMSEASDLKTWNAVFDSYKKYKQCDDGAIAEGYSSSVAYLLADKWGNIVDLISLSKKNPGFRQFVLKHVDETMSFEQGEVIKSNIKDHCPSNGKRLCIDIQHRFVDAG